MQFVINMHIKCPDKPNQSEKNKQTHNRLDNVIVN